MTIIEELFASGNSVVHKLDPRIKMVCATLFTLTIAVSERFHVLIASFCVSITLVLLARLNLKKILKRFTVLLSFLLLIWIVVPVTFEGKTVIDLGLLSVTKQGILLSARVTVKSLSILMALISLTATMKLTTLGQTLGLLKIPGKLVHLFMMTYRYISVIEREYERLSRSIMIRGFKPGTNLHTYRTFAFMIGMLFVRASTRADRVYQAMQCRGFDGTFFSVYRPTVYGGNWIFSITMLIILIVLIMMEWGLFVITT